MPSPLVSEGQAEAEPSHPLSRCPIQNKLEGVPAWQAPKWADGSQWSGCLQSWWARFHLPQGFPLPQIFHWCVSGLWGSDVCLTEKWDCVYGQLAVGPGPRCLLACQRDVGSTDCEGRCSDALSYFCLKPPVEGLDTSVCTHVHTPTTSCIHTY